MRPRRRTRSPDRPHAIVTLCEAPLRRGFVVALHGLTYHDASYVATARALRMRLATGDRAIVEAGGDERPSAIADDLGLRY